MTDTEAFGVFGEGSQLCGTPGFAPCEDDLCERCSQQRGPQVFELDVPMVVQLKSGAVRPLTHNDRFHYRKRARLVAAIREAVGWAAKAKKIPPSTNVTVQLHYRPGTGRPSVTDAPNLTATSKPAIDGLQDAGIVPTDTDKHVTEVMPVIHSGPGKRRCWLTVEVA